MKRQGIVGSEQWAVGSEEKSVPPYPPILYEYQKKRVTRIAIRN
jgi:hypothetical protein